MCYPLLALGLCVWNGVAWYDVRGDEATDRLVPLWTLMVHQLIGGVLLRGVHARARTRASAASSRCHRASRIYLFILRPATYYGT